MEGGRGTVGKPGRKGGRRCTGGGKREGGKQDSQGGGKQDKFKNYATLDNILQSEKAQRGESQQKRGGSQQTSCDIQVLHLYMYIKGCFHTSVSKSKWQKNKMMCTSA